jgi:hypothetical protein
MSKCSGCSQPDVSGYCRTCAAAYKKKYRATPEGRAVTMWNDMAKRAGNRSGRHKSYESIKVQISRDDFLRWAVPAITAFKTAHPYELASIDRINPDGDYAAGNIRILPYRENSRLSRRKMARRIKAERGLPWRASPVPGPVPAQWATEVAKPRYRPPQTRTSTAVATSQPRAVKVWGPLD